MLTAILAFNQIKALLAEDVLLAYPDPNLPFHVYTDASDLQLGAVIMQNGRPVAYYSRKLTPAQRNYTVMEKELLSIVETLKAYRNMLYGCKELHVHTDHKNLTYTKLNSRRILRWRLELEDFAPIFHYIKGSHNAIADSLSRLGIRPFALEEQKSADTDIESSSSTEDSDLSINHSFFIELFSYHPDFFESYPTIDCPLPCANIRQHQLNDPALMHLAAQQPALYQWRPFNGIMLLCKNVQHAPVNYKIFIPNSLVHDVLVWYHQTLGHVGETRLDRTISTHMTFPSLDDRVKIFCDACRTCKVMKHTGRGCGHLAPRLARLLPFEEIAVDSIGPWTVHLPGRIITFNALTTIDTVSCLAELMRKRDGTAAEAFRCLEFSWLYRYPRPLRCIHDNGPEFGYSFLRQLQSWGIDHVPTTTHNPQANSICERMHKTVADILRTYVATNPPQNEAEAQGLVDRALAVASHALRSSIHRTLKCSQGALVFHRDMSLNLPLLANLLVLQDRRQQIIDYNLQRANAKRHDYRYRVNDFVSEIELDPAKMDPRITHNRFRIVEVRQNGTLVIERLPGVFQTINIRRVRPVNP